MTLWGKSDMSRAIARLKGDRSPFNTSPSDLPEIAGDFRAANLQGSFFLYAPRLSLRSVAGFACVLPFGLRLQAQSASRTLSVDRLPAVKKAPPAAYMPPRTIKDRGAPPPIPPASQRC